MKSITRTTCTLSVFCSGLLLVSSLFIFGPFEIYLANIKEYSLPLSELLISLSGFFLLGLVFFTAIGLLIPEKLRSVFISLIFVLAIAFYIQGNMLFTSYGHLDGTDIDFEKFSSQNWLELPIWIGLILCGFIFHKKLSQQATFISLVIVLLLTVSSVFQYTQYSAAFNAKTPPADTAINQELFELSPTFNVIHILLDQLQSDIALDILQQQTSEFDAKDFVIYNNNIGAFPVTQFSIPALLTGKSYDNTVPMREFIDQSMEQDAYYHILHREGYAVDLITQNNFLPKKFCNSECVNCKDTIAAFDVSSTDTQRVAYKLADFSLFRYSPHLLKQSVYNDEKWFFSTFLNNDALNFIPAVARDNLQYFTDELYVGSQPQPRYKFFHLVLPHLPIALDKDCTFIGKQTMSKQAYRKQAECSLSLFAQFIDRLKSLGVYDNSLIVLSSDHGIHTVLSDSALAAQMIKFPNTSAGLEVSELLTSNLDIPATILDALEINGFDNYGESILRMTDSANRQRVYRYHKWSSAIARETYIPQLENYTITGDAKNTDNWVDSGTIYPGGKKASAGSDGQSSNLSLNFDGRDSKLAFASGWTGSKGSWGHGEEQVVLMALPENTATIKAKIHVPEVNLPQQFSLLINGSLSKTFTVEKSEWITLSFPVEPSMLVDGKSTLVFQSTNTNPINNGHLKLSALYSKVYVVLGQ